MQLDTLCVHAGEEPRLAGSAVAPIFQSATFVHTGEETSYDAVRYTRCNNNPSQLVVAAKLAALEGTEAALVLSSGMAAISTTLLTLLSAGDHMLIQEAAYGGTFDLVHTELPRLDISATKVDISQPCDTWRAALRPNTRLVYVEAISNPLMQVPDLPGVVAFARAHGLLAVIDATFATPALFQPAKAGFDVVLHSGTKYLNGHSDLIAGVVAGKQELVAKILSKANHLGCSLDPHAAFLLQRGIKTLALRVERQSATAAALAAALDGHPQVERVFYPGLPSHPRHGLIQELFRGGAAGGMLAFEVAGGVAMADAVLQHLHLALVAPSLGGVESLVTRPAATTHVGLTQQQRLAIGISDGLIRLSVGIEDANDLIADFMAALDAAAAALRGGEPAA